MSLNKGFWYHRESPALVEDQDATSRSRAQARQNFLVYMY